MAHLVCDGKDVIDIRRVCMAGDLTDAEWSAFVGRLAEQYPKDGGPDQLRDASNSMRHLNPNPERKS